MKLLKSVPLIVWAILLLFFAIVYAGGRHTIHEVKYAYFSTNTAIDTASVTTIEPLYAVDGYRYIDTFSYGTDTADHCTLSWVAPYQTMYLTIEPITATPTLIDTTVATGMGTIVCSVQFAAETLGFDYDANLCATATLEDAIDSLVAQFNLVTNLKDSVLAQDSATYIKLISKFSEAVNTKRWTVSFYSSAGAPADSCDTLGWADSTTIAMVCDSMTATINAHDSISVYAIAANSGDTAYTITALDAGLQLFDSTLNPEDTHGTVNRTTANAANSSIMTDTLKEYNILLIANDFRALGINGDIVLDHPASDSVDSLFGLGLSDSAALWLKTWKDSAGVRVYRDLDSVWGTEAAGLPLTLHIARIPAWANDTLFFNGLVLMWYISDTLSDTVVDRAYPITIDLNLTEM